MIKNIPGGHKALKDGVTVTRGNRTYKGSCPEEFHPDNLKKSAIKNDSDINSSESSED